MRFGRICLEKLQVLESAKFGFRVSGFHGLGGGVVVGLASLLQAVHSVGRNYRISQLWDISIQV